MQEKITMHAEGVPATNADIHIEKKNTVIVYSSLKFVVIDSREHR